MILNVGDADTAQTGGAYWCDEEIVTRVKAFVYNGGGFIGVGGKQPTSGRANSSSWTIFWAWKRKTALP